MSHLDYELVLFFNQFAHRSWTLDTFFLLCACSPLLRGGTTAILIWWAWFKEGKDQRRNREILLYGIIASLCAVLVARTVTHVLPFRPRPIHNPGLVLRFAEGLSRKTLLNWSSFPSDHAALFFTLAAILWLVSRRTGVLATAQVLFLVCLPRVCLGLHYPGDILGGGVIGVSLAILGRSATVRGLVAGPALRWIDRHPQYFYATFFFLTYMIGMVFDPVPELWSFAATVARTGARRIHTLPVWTDIARMGWPVRIGLFLVAGSLLAIMLRSVWIRRHSRAYPALSPGATK